MDDCRPGKIKIHAGLSEADQQVAMATMLGNASVEDHKLIPTVFTEVFGVHGTTDDALARGNLF